MRRLDEYHGTVMDWTAAVSSELFEVALVSWSIAVIIEETARKEIWE
jgi:hypothetical protein